MSYPEQTEQDVLDALRHEEDIVERLGTAYDEDRYLPDWPEDVEDEEEWGGPDG